MAPVSGWDFRLGMTFGQPLARGLGYSRISFATTRLDPRVRRA
jgi:hypothetical protein